MREWQKTEAKKLLQDPINCTSWVVIEAEHLLKDNVIIDYQKHRIYAANIYNIIFDIYPLEKATEIAIHHAWSKIEAVIESHLLRHHLQTYGI